MTAQSGTLPAERYERAAAFAPPRFAPKLTGTADGYWIDGEHYFFCVAESDADGTIAWRPKIADAANATVTTIVELDALAALISGHSEKQVDAAALATAQYDMPDADTLVVMLGPDAFHIALDGLALTKVEPLEPVAALHSPDGRYAAFLKDHAVWIRDRATGTASQLSPDGEPNYAWGIGPEAGTNPVSARGHPIPNGLWSADSQWFVTHRIDERALPDGGLVEHVPAGGKRAVPHIYKVAGPDAELALIEFVAFHVPSGRSVSSAERPVLCQPFSPFGFKSCWFAGGNLYFLEWDRFSSELALVEMDLATGALRTVLDRKAESGWLDVHPMIVGQPMIRPLPATGELIWYSDADGHGHLQLHDLATGALKNPITTGAWVVREIVHIAEAERRILFLASGFENAADPGHRRLCVVNFDGGGFDTLLAIEGDVAAKPDPVSGVDQLRPFRPSYAPSGASADGRYVAVIVGAVDSPTRTILLNIGSGQQIELAKSNIETIWTAPKPQPFEVLAADGVTKLHGAMYFPTGFDATKSYPLVDYIYPGPQLNWFVRRFPGLMALTLQSVVELGMIGIILETRGMPNRDRAFHQAGQGRMLEPQLSDHVAAIEQLCESHAFLDRTRVGMFGQSGGGHATARAMFDYPEVFKVGVSVCGNHDNRNYIAHWIDKYGGRPGTSERDDQSNVAVAHKLQGKLLLIHGDMDDNVHVAHTLAVSAALIAANKDFEHLIVPGAGHGVIMESPYAYRRQLDFFARHLIGAEPPAEFALAWTPADYGAAMRMMMDVV
jgi:dipeptidyl aminopeptidase/acylaminoacyl peptidase